MIKLLIVLVVVSIVAGALGFTGIARGAASAAKIIFFYSWRSYSCWSCSRRLASPRSSDPRTRIEWHARWAVRAVAVSIGQGRAWDKRPVPATPWQSVTLLSWNFRSLLYLP